MTSVGAGRRWATVVGVGGVLALAGCSDGGAAKPSVAPSTITAPPEPTAAPSPTPTVTEPGTVVAPERPAEMANGDEAGAQAAAEYFVELYGYTVQSQDLTEFTALCDAASKFCGSVTEAVAADINEGARMAGGATVLRTKRIDSPSVDKAFTIWGELDREPLTVTGPDGAVLYESAGEDGLPFAVLAEFVPGDGWIVRGAEADVVPQS